VKKSRLLVRLLEFKLVILIAWLWFLAACGSATSGQPLDEVVVLSGNSLIGSGAASVTRVLEVSHVITLSEKYNVAATDDPMDVEHLYRLSWWLAISPPQRTGGFVANVELVGKEADICISPPKNASIMVLSNPVFLVGLPQKVRMLNWTGKCQTDAPSKTGF
jgi:hypothetical protein